MVNCSDSDNHRSLGGDRLGKGGNVAAKYKLMPPGKLLLLRPPPPRPMISPPYYCCITNSPTSGFMDSPLFLPNHIKAEPSPTTGSFMPASARSSTSSSINCCSIDVSGRKSNCFEFQPQSESTYVSVSSLDLADMNPKPSEQAIQQQSDSPSQTVASSIAGAGQAAASSSGLVLSTPAEADPGVSSQIDHANIKVSVPPPESDHKGVESSLAGERACEDGYNWRKYGQKLVKGGEYPRSYYKCTHPSCDVKKLFERAPDGQTTEIIYKGRHDHPKPLPSRRVSAGSMMPIQEEPSEKPSSFNCQEAYNYESSMNQELSPHATNNTSMEVGVPQSNRTNVDNSDDDDPSKRRKLEIAIADINTVIRPIREPRVVVQTVSEIDILDDGYRWRKYGQKVVRSNPNPRSYYKCTSAGCPVRKLVERASHDPKAVITTYEGKHNHDVPSAKTSSHDATARTSLVSSPMSRQGQGMSLNLTVGVNLDVDRIVHDRNIRPEPGQTQLSSSNCLLVQAPPIGAFPAYIHGGMLLYGTSADNHIGHSGGDRSISPYQQTTEQILMHP